jgi:hypothetical protein
VASDYFPLEELLSSDTAISRGIGNYPSWADVGRLDRLSGVLGEIRRICGDLPVTVNSAYRCAALNEAVGGVEDSAHLLGLAADIVVPGVGSSYDVVELLRPYIEALAIDQLIDETGWVHVGLSEGEPRHDCFRIEG